jgi:hypothetical protein
MWLQFLHGRLTFGMERPVFQRVDMEEKHAPRPHDALHLGKEGPSPYIIETSSNICMATLDMTASKHASTNGNGAAISATSNAARAGAFVAAWWIASRE